MARAVKYWSPAEEHDNEATFLRRVRPEGWKNPKPREIYDLVIIGAGPAGLEAADFAARAGFAVALIERNRLGGNSLNVGSAPSKAIFGSARNLASMRESAAFGATLTSAPVLGFDQVMARIGAIRTRLSVPHSVENLTALGIDIFFDSAVFESADTLNAGDSRLRFRKALIASGARPMTPHIPGLDQTRYHTSSTIFDLKVLPERLAVIGGGPLGCEMAQAFRRLGSQVTIVQDEAKFLPREERDAAEILSRSMAQDGVDIRLNTTVIGARREGGDSILKTVNNDVEGELRADVILLSVGRVAIVEGMGLAAAGVVSDPREGIRVDAFLCSTNPNIYASGDCCLSLKFTNAARTSARMAVKNALMRAHLRWSDSLIPWCTYCEPEIAHIGAQVWDARQQGVPIKSFTVMMHDVDRAVTDGRDTGFVKIHVAEGTDVILGATIVASRASELVNEMAVIISSGIGMKALSEITHTYPAESEAIILAAKACRRALDAAAIHVA